MSCMEHSCTNPNCDYDFTINNNSKIMDCPKCGHSMKRDFDEIPDYPEPENWNGDNPEEEPR